MRRISRFQGVGLCRATVGAAALVSFGASAATAAPQQEEPPVSPATVPAGAAQAVDPNAAPADSATADSAKSDIVVTGSRIDRAGFDAPTPTTVVGETELREGARASVNDVLNDLPQFRATSTPQSTTASFDSSAASPDLRGLGSIRTLTLLDGRRFTGSFDLNNVPLTIVKRVEVVTGGASAAWGSGAVAGVVNVVLDDEFKGIRIGGGTGVSSRGDAQRHRLNGAAGTTFAGGRGHVMAAIDFVDETGAFNRNGGDRPNLDGSLFTDPGGNLVLARDVNTTTAFPGGVIDSGVLSNQVFNTDGTLRPYPLGTQTTGGFTLGGGGRGQLDYIPVTSPYQRVSTFGRASYEVADQLTFWVDGTYSDIHANFGFFPDAPIVDIRSDNAFLSPSIRSTLAAAGESSFQFGRILDDTGLFTYRYNRRNVEGAIGFDGHFGKTFKYSGYYGHGVLTVRDALYNQRISDNFTNAIDAVLNPAGTQVVCRIALADPTTPCRPLNLFGSGNASTAAVSYAFGEASRRTTTKLDTGSLSVRGDLFDDWAGPISIAAGFEARRESQEIGHIDALSQAGAFGTINYSPLKGSFSVKEGFGEALVPLLNVTDRVKIDFNGAARYSDYSTSGGIWSWKLGLTARLWDSLLLRAVRSRDIRSASVAELFTTQSINYGPVVDPSRNNEVISIFQYGGGNPGLVPETAKTTTLGFTFSPKFLPGFNLSTDFYSIDIDKVIGQISPQTIISQCFAGVQSLCGQVVRNADGTIASVSATNINLASYKTRGVDIETSYRLRLSAPGSSIRLRALATYVDRLILDDRTSIIDVAGVVGDGVAITTTPHWRATGGFTYTNRLVNLDARVRYVGGGVYSNQLPIVNNTITSRTYVDLGAQVEIAKRLTLSATVTNLFDRDPPIVNYASPTYDQVGRYFEIGVQVKL